MLPADLGLVAVGVVVEADQVDLLAVLPLAVHLEGAVAHGREEERVEVLERRVGHRGERRVHADVGEVGVRLDELHDEGVVVGAGDALEFGRLALGHLGVALDHREVVGDVGGRRLGGLGVANALPGLLERLGGHGGAVVELGALHEGEGELVGGVVGLIGLGGQALELALLEVVRHECVEELVADLHALVFLGVVRVDGDRVVDVVVQRAAGGLAGGGGGVGAALLAAGGEGGERAGGQAALHERAPTHRGLVHWSSLSCDAEREPVSPVPVRHGLREVDSPMRDDKGHPTLPVRAPNDVAKSPRLQTYLQIMRERGGPDKTYVSFTSVKKPS